MIKFSENPLTISEKSLKFSVVYVTVAENFSDISLIPNGFSLNEILKRLSPRISEIPLIQI